MEAVEVQIVARPQIADKAPECKALGRNFDELKGALIAMQTADAYAVARPIETKQDGVTCYDWFFCTKQLSIDQVNHPKAIKV